MVKPSARMIAKTRRRRRTEVISLSQRSDLATGSPQKPAAAALAAINRCFPGPSA
jgi:hypothetical protein